MGCAQGQDGTPDTVVGWAAWAAVPSGPHAEQGSPTTSVLHQRLSPTPRPRQGRKTALGWRSKQSRITRITTCYRPVPFVLG